MKDRAGRDIGETEQQRLVAKVRINHGTRQVRRLRRSGVVPGVVYGKAIDPVAVVVSRKDLIKFLHARAGEHGVITLRVEAQATSASAKTAKEAKGQSWEKPVLIKGVQHDPVDGEIVHIDFHAIALTEQIRVKIPMVLQGESVGVKQEGGVLEHFLREIEVECLPTAIPKEMAYDISALKIGDAVHVRDLTAPPGTKITTDVEGVIASVLAPKEEKVEEAAAAAVTEPEVIREKKPEAEAAAEPTEGKEGKRETKAEKKEEKKPEK